MLHLSILTSTIDKVLELLILSSQSLLDGFVDLTILILTHLLLNGNVHRHLLVRISGQMLLLLKYILSEIKVLILTGLLILFLGLCVNEPEVGGGISKPENIVVPQSLSIALRYLMAIQVAAVER